MSREVRVADHLVLSYRALMVLGGLICLELLAVGVWFRVADWRLLRASAAAHPLVWINVAIFAVMAVRRRPSTFGRRWPAAVVALAYLGLLAWIGGVIDFRGGGVAVELLWLPPGWGPVLKIGTPWVGLTLFPYQVIGYVTLAYLAYRSLLDAFGAVTGAIVGLASCIGCTVPIAAGLGATLVGGSVPLAFGGAGRPAALGTVVFLVAVAALLWRPPGDPARDARQSG
ncbi:MAG: hypothetical protein ABEJ35_08030 [Halobacteriaceae archaeon]